MLRLTNEDNLKLMARYPNKYFDLAIVDPPYGIAHKSLNGNGKLKNRAFAKLDTSWDITPSPDYFNELFRVSKHQIIWGGNYFTLPPSRGVLIWDKQQHWSNFSAFEYAWTSFNSPAKIYKERFNKQLNKIHPTQKSVDLYKWLITTYAKSGQSILDTHLGSASIAIACYDLKFDLTACELNNNFFNAALERVKKHIVTTTL